eukprot:7115394-Prorocentrum_lima.AAC.1
MEGMIQRAEEYRNVEHFKVVKSLEETARSHHNAVVMKQKEEFEAQLQLKQPSANHENSVLASHAIRQGQHVLVVHKN